jgi:hypothetical protein
VQTEIIELTQLAARRRAPLGEFLVERRVLDRFQLFRALQMQDRVPGARLGDCAVALGYAARDEIEQSIALLHQQLAEPDLDAQATTAFRRPSEIDIEIEPA